MEDIRLALDNEIVTGGELKALKSNIADRSFSAHELAVLRSKVFRLFKDKYKAKSDIDRLSALEQIIKLLIPQDQSSQQDDMNNAYFSPGDKCKNAIIQHLGLAQQHVDICVFTISDDDIANKILDIHKRGINVRIITDNDKVNDRGSDIHMLSQAGINTKTDSTDDHMHHKFALIDHRFLINGSFNWTRSASERNQENVVITNNKALITKFADYYDKLWDEMMQY